MKPTAIVACAALLSIVTYSPRPSLSQSAHATSPDSIREKASKIAEYKSLLNDKEQSVRIAAFDEMINSGDPTLQEVAFEVGFSSADLAMRTLALRERLVHLASFTFQVGEYISGNQDVLKNNIPSNITYKVIAADPHAGVIAIWHTPVHEAAQATATVSASGLDLILNAHTSSPTCWGSFRLDDTGAFTGPITCTAGAVVTFKGRGRVF